MLCIVFAGEIYFCYDITKTGHEREPEILLCSSLAIIIAFCHNLCFSASTLGVGGKPWNPISRRYGGFIAHPLSQARHSDELRFKNSAPRLFRLRALSSPTLVGVSLSGLSGFCAVSPKPSFLVLLRIAEQLFQSCGFAEDGNVADVGFDIEAGVNPDMT